MNKASLTIIAALFLTFVNCYHNDIHMLSGTFYLYEINRYGGTEWKPYTVFHFQVKNMKQVHQSKLQQPNN
ncbi:unnamed protein product, partial [Callosobruchus maculatus]